jgi:hypothetical protein
MLIYEKNNKLNINFENSVNGEPDLQIGKDGDKTEVLIDGQPGGGSGSYDFVLASNGVNPNSQLNKTWNEIYTNFQNKVIFWGENLDQKPYYLGIVVNVRHKNDAYDVSVCSFNDLNTKSFRTDDPDSYPTIPDKI